MTATMIEQFMDSVVRGTLTGLCVAIWILCLIAVWKWAFGMLKKALFCLFPGLIAWAERRKRAKEKTVGSGKDED